MDRLANQRNSLFAALGDGDAPWEIGHECTEPVFALLHDDNVGGCKTLREVNSPACGTVATPKAVHLKFSR